MVWKQPEKEAVSGSNSAPKVLGQGRTRPSRYVTEGKTRGKTLGFIRTLRESLDPSQLDGW